jgi:hypothetical protein
VELTKVGVIHVANTIGISSGVGQLQASVNVQHVHLQVSQIGIGKDVSDHLLEIIAPDVIKSR